MTRKNQNKQKKKSTSANLANFFYFTAIPVLAVIAFLAWQGNRSPAAPSSTVSPESLALGEAVYQTSCASCHGVDLEGEDDWQSPNTDGTLRSPPHNEAGHTWHHGDSYLISRIRNGTTDLDVNMQQRSNMPAFSETLTEEEITSVLEYIKSEWPTEIQLIQAERTAAEETP